MRNLTVLWFTCLFTFASTSALQACTTEGAPDLSHYENELQDTILRGLTMLFIRDAERNIPKEGLEARNFTKLDGWTDGDNKYVMEISYDLTLIKDPREFGQYAASKRGTLRKWFNLTRKGDSKTIKLNVIFRKTEKGWRIEDTKAAKA